MPPKYRNKQKVIYVITKANFGGAQRYVLDLSREIKKKGHEIMVITQPEGPLVRKLLLEDIDVVGIESFQRDVHAGKEMGVFFHLLKIFWKERPGVVHLNSSKAGGLGALAARITFVPRIIYTIHGLPYFERRSRVANLLIKLSTWITILLSHTSIVISKHDFKAAHSLPFAKKKLSYIPVTMTAPQFLERKDARRGLREYIPGAVNPTIIFSIGELVKNKGYEWAIPAMKEALGDNVYWIIAGEGSDGGKLKKLIRKEKLEGKAVLAGQVPNAARLLPGADIFFMPSYKEGLPYALLEAGFAGLPAIASRVGGIPDLLIHGKTGLLVNPEDTTALLETLEKLITDTELRERLGNAFSEKVAREFMFDAMVQQTLSVYFG